MVSVLLFALLTSAPGSAGGGSQDVVPVCVVAHVGAAVGVGGRELVRRVFLLRQRFWPDRSPARPVNLPATSPVRERFTRALFGQSVRDQVAYWNERYFHGTRPPPSVGSEEAVLLFVSRTEGAVGYVREPETHDLPDDVRVLMCLGARD